MIRNVDGSIKVFTAPPGDPPADISEMWVGLTLPVVGIGTMQSQGILSGAPTGEIEAYLVSQEAALNILAEKSPPTAEWWKSKGFPHKNEVFCFNIECAVVITELKDTPAPRMRQFHGLLEVGVGAHDAQAPK